MSMISDELLHLDDMNEETAKVSDLIFVLRSAFHPKDYKKVSDILISRETKLKEEIQHWKSEFELKEKKEGEAILAKIKAEVEISKYKRQLDNMAEKVTHLEEDFILIKEDNRLYRERVLVLEERESRMRAKHGMLLEENERLERENRELGLKKCESETERVKAERELEKSRKRNEEHELRISRLEEGIKEISSYSRKENRVVEDKIPNDDVINEAQVKEVIFNGNEKNNVDTNMNQRKEAGVGFGIHPCSEGITFQNQIERERGETSHRDIRPNINTAESLTVIEISDSEDEIPTQNQTPNVPSVTKLHILLKEEQKTNSISEKSESGNQCTSSSKRKRGSFLEIGVRENGSISNGFPLLSSSDSDSDCDSDFMNLLTKKEKGSSSASASGKDCGASDEDTAK